MSFHVYAYMITTEVFSTLTNASALKNWGQESQLSLTSHAMLTAT